MASPKVSAASVEVPLPRSAGVLLHVTSLPGPYGIGDLGPAAYAWVDQLHQAKQSWWQILPLNPPGAGGSPYQAYSAFAGNPVLVSPEFLVRDGLLEEGDMRRPRVQAGHVDFPAVSRFKWQLLATAFERFRGARGRRLRTEFDAFCAVEASWLDDYACFMALRDAHGGASWTDWPRPLVIREPGALAEARRALADDVERHQFAQFLFFLQWAALRQYANDRGVRIIGDLPIYVSGDSADVWANAHLFQLNRHRRPTAVAGVPPDAFSETGQCWGNPLYNWSAMRREDYAWWAARFRALLKQVDLVRVDHFRGFAGYWKIPADAPDARSGRWVKGPGMALFESLRRQLGTLPLIAEDLGVITPDVEALRDANGLPGMRVLQFAFGGGGENPHLPHNHLRHSAAYTGTHDNDTTVGWYQSLSAKERNGVRAYGPSIDDEPAWELLRLTWSSVARLAIAPAQDLLSIDSSARMNTPGTAAGNWTWRLTRPIPKRPMARLRGMTQLYFRESGETDD